MADPTNPPGNTTQGQPLQQVGKPTKSQTTFRAKWQNNWLRRLRSLPESAYRQCVARLQRGELAHGVAVWLMTLPDRGGMQSATSVPMRSLRAAGLLETGGSGRSRRPLREPKFLVFGTKFLS